VTRDRVDLGAWGSGPGAAREVWPWSPTKSEFVESSGAGPGRRLARTPPAPGPPSVRPLPCAPFRVPPSGCRHPSAAIRAPSSVLRRRCSTFRTPAAGLPPSGFRDQAPATRLPNSGERLRVPRVECARLGAYAWVHTPRCTRLGALAWVHSLGCTRPRPFLRALSPRPHLPVPLPGSAHPGPIGRRHPGARVAAFRLPLGWASNWIG